MEALQKKAEELLAQGAVKAVLGYEPGTSGRRRPLVARTAEQARRLVFDDACGQNLARYLTRPEVRRLGRLAVVARPEVLRSILQLAAERQLQEGEVLALAVTAEGVQELPSFQAIEAYLAPAELSPEDRRRIEELAAMTPAERWAFWQSELARCVKCYACRNSCPMCYCGHCTMDCNRPQWVPVPSHALGNLEYHMVRAMHLAGRCVTCGACGRACPAGIPVHLLTGFAQESVRRQFGQAAGTSAAPDYALSVFRPDDSESFIR